MDREGGQGGSALTIQISQAGWTDVSYLSIYLSIIRVIWSLCLGVGEPVHVTGLCYIKDYTSSLADYPQLGWAATM